MTEQLLIYLEGLPDFLAYFATAAALTVLYAVIYTLLTPHHEWQLIKKNVPAASVAFGGSLVGFILPLASAIEHSVNLIDCALWGGIALIVQLVTFFIVRLFVPGISQRITNNEMAAGIWLASASIGAGLLNAASLTY